MLPAPRLAAPLLALALLSCSDDGNPARTFILSNGAEVVVSADGGVVLEVDGRTTYAIPPETGPTVVTFRERAMESTAIWTFRRAAETRVPLQATGAPAVTDEGSVAIAYASADGALSGTLDIAPDGAERTRFRFALDAPPTTTDEPSASLAIPARCDDEGSFHGFGEMYNRTEQRGEHFDIFTQEQGIGRDGSVRALTGDEHTTYFAMPWWLDGRGHGVLFRTDHRVRAFVCAPAEGEDDAVDDFFDAGVAWMDVVNDAAPVEWAVYHGPTPLDVIRQLGDEVGRPAPLPDWAFEPWMAFQGGREVVLEELARVEAAEIPFSALWVQDWTGIRPNIGGFGVEYRWEHDEELYPELPAMVADLHERGYKFLAYANPFVDPALPNHFDEMAEMGLLMQDAEGEPYLFTAPNTRPADEGGGAVAAHPDLTNPEAVAYVQDALRNMITEYGFDGWMQDFAEWTPLDAVLSDGSDPRAYHNRFVVEWQRMAREAFEAERPDGDFAFFGRSGWTGVQGAGQIHWAGDQEADFEETDGLPTVVPALLTLGLAGQPHVTHDIAGFSGGPSTKELFLRWTELGAFTPIMRTHDGNMKFDNWSWEGDAETTEHFRRFARVHVALAPLFRELADEAQASSAPILRHLMLEFPEDRATWEVHDQFLIGDALLVAPVVHEGQTAREVYLPAGEWFHVWTGERFEGGQTVMVDAPIGSPPVFSRGEDRADLRAIE